MTRDERDRLRAQLRAAQELDDRYAVITAMVAPRTGETRHERARVENAVRWAVIDSYRALPALLDRIDELEAEVETLRGAS